MIEQWLELLKFFIGTIQFTNDWPLVLQAGSEVKAVKC